MSAIVPPGTTLQDVLDPSYWANHAFRLKPGAIIEVLSEDNILDCELRVLELGPTFAKVRCLRQYIEAAAPKKVVSETVTDEVRVDYGGKSDRWRVVHMGEVVASNLGSREDAEKAAEEYRSKFAA